MNQKCKATGLSGNSFLGACCPLLALTIIFSPIAEFQMALKIAKKNWSHLHNPHGRAPFQDSIARGQSLSTLNLESTAGLGQRSKEIRGKRKNSDQQLLLSKLLSGDTYQTSVPITWHTYLHIDSQWKSIQKSIIRIANLAIFGVKLKHTAPTKNAKRLIYSPHFWSNQKVPWVFWGSLNEEFPAGLGAKPWSKILSMCRMWLGRCFWSTVSKNLTDVLSCEVFLGNDWTAANRVSFDAVVRLKILHL